MFSLTKPFSLFIPYSVVNRSWSVQPGRNHPSAPIGRQNEIFEDIFIIWTINFNGDHIKDNQWLCLTDPNIVPTRNLRLYYTLCAVVKAYRVSKELEQFFSFSLFSVSFLFSLSLPVSLAVSRALFLSLSLPYIIRKKIHLSTTIFTCLRLLKFEDQRVRVERCPGA